MKRTTVSNRRVAMLGVIALAAAGLGPALSATPEAAQAPASTTASPAARVSVTYDNPDNFTEARQFGQEDRFNGVTYLEPLKTHLVKQAARMLPPGYRLNVTITDIKLAGAYEPWQGIDLRHVRFMKDIYPPRIDLTFQLIGSDGKVLREGSRKLRDMGYLQGNLLVSNTDRLRYDKALIDRWLRRGPDKL